MTPEQHRRAGELFDQLCEIAEPQRNAYLEAACASDPEVRRHVAALLAAESRAPRDFLGEPAIHVAARQLAAKSTDSSELTGAIIGNYRLGPPIGAGGMGTVHEAHDIRLNRRVAVKILPSMFAAHPDRVERFQREARAASLLNHPNIVSIYDADQSAGQYYIATEFVEGRTLRQMLHGGPLDLKDVLEIAVQIASALGAAHEAGIVHRDIKPENVMVRPDGFVKVLDFGLAKLTEPRDSDGPNLETRPGQVAGTLQYLSPEQVLGKPTGPRSDLFSLGTLLYELTTGVRPFDGPTDGAVFEAIVNRLPVQPSSLRPSLQREFEEVLLRTLEKDPELRFQTAVDLRSALRRLMRASSPAAASVPTAKPGRLLPVALALSGAVVAALAIGWWASLAARRPLLSLPVRFERLTDGPGEEIFPSLSADGKQFLYSSAVRGKWDIYLQRTGGATAVNLTAESKDDDTQPSLSPDGTRIAFRSERDGGGIFLMEATGENPTRLTREGYLPAWSPDGKRLVYSSVNFIIPSSRLAPVSRLHVLQLATGAERVLDTADAIQPNWSPHGYRIAYWGMASGGRRDIFTVGVDSGNPTAVTHDAPTDWNPVWSPDGGALYFISDRGGSMNLWRVPIDERTGRTLGEPVPVTVPADSVEYLNFSQTGSFAFAQSRQRNNLFAVHYNPARQTVTGEPESIGNSAHDVTVFSFSPDESQLVHDDVGAVTEDLWIMNRDGTAKRRLTSDPFRDRSPAWSPHGDQIAFFSDRGGGMYNVWTIRPDGSDPRQLTAVTSPVINRPVWSADGTRILVTRHQGPPAIIDLKPQGTVEPHSLPGLDAYPGAIFSPWPSHGDLLVAEWNGGSGWELLFYDVSRRVAHLPGVKGRRPEWMPDSRQVVFGRGGKCMLYDPDSRRESELFSVAPNTLYSIHPSRDARRIYFSQTIRDADLWIGHMGN